MMKQVLTALVAVAFAVSGAQAATTDAAVGAKTDSAKTTKSHKSDKKHTKTDKKHTKTDKTSNGATDKSAKPAS